MAATVTEQTIVLRTITLDGRPVEVAEVYTDRALQGVGDKHYAVNVRGDASHQAMTYGFTSLAQAKRFLSSFDEEDYSGYDVSGQKITNTRQGLGIPAALFSEAGKAKEEKALTAKRVQEETADKQALQADADKLKAAQTPPR